MCAVCTLVFETLWCASSIAHCPYFKYRSTEQRPIDNTNVQMCTHNVRMCGIVGCGHDHKLAKGICFINFHKPSCEHDDNFSRLKRIFSINVFKGLE